MPDQRSSRLYRDPNLQIIFAVTLMAILGVSSITPAFPLMARKLDVPPERIGWLITYFTFPGAVLTPIMGVLSDRFGRKKILVPALMLFGLAGTACALVRDFETLLLLRFFQGAGASSLGAINVTIMGDLYTGRERTRVMGYNASVLSVGTASFPVIGGALAMIDWYYPFYLAVIAVPIGLLVLFFLKSPEPTDQQNIREYMAGVWENIRKRQVVGLMMSGLVTFIILYGSYLTYFPFFIKDSFGGTPFVIGLVMCASSAATAVTSAKLGTLARAYSEGALLKAGYILFAVSLALVPYVGNIWTLLVPAVIFGVATGINIPNILTLLAGLAPMNQRGAIMSINGTVLRLGQTLGPIIMASVFASWGPTGTFLVGAALAVFVFVIAALMIR